MSKPIVTGYDWAPDRGQGLVRDMRVRWALEEVGQPYDARLLFWGQQKESAHRARSPFGQVPTYEDGDLTLFESGAIVLHIAMTHDGLLPTEPAARMRAIGWMFAALNTVEPVVWDLVICRIVERDKPWFDERVKDVQQRLRVRLDELTTRLGDADWLDGDFSAGDLLMVQVLRHAAAGGALPDHPTLAAYVARGEARPAFARALADLRAGLTGQPPAGWPR